MTYIRQMDFNPANMSAFGSLETAELTPSVQGDYITGLNTQLFMYSYKFTVTAPAAAPAAGDVYTNNNGTFFVLYAVSTTLIAYGSSIPAASGTLTRSTGSGDATITYSAYTTGAGVANGTGATIDTNGGRMRIQGGTAAAGFAFLQSRRPIRYRAGQGTLARMTPIFTAGAADSYQIYGVGAMSGIAPQDGYFWGYNGTSFGICHYNGGSPTWYSQTSDWNGDKINGGAGTSFTYDPAKGTPLMIKYPYLGYGNISFWAQVPTTSAWTLCHTIRYANSSATTQLTNPTLYFLGAVVNSGNTSNLTLYNGSYGAFVSGVRALISNPSWTWAHNKSSITTETNILSIRNASSYNGLLNRSTIRVQSITVSSSAASGIAIFRFKLGVTLGGTPSYTAINGTLTGGGEVITSGNSVASYDTAGTTITGGTLIRSYSVDNPNSTLVDLYDDNIVIAPGEVLTISGFSSATSELSVAINWTEDI